MKTVITWTAAFVTLAALAFAGVPQTINYQGYLKNTAGSPVTGSVPMTFSLYSSANPRNNPVWVEPAKPVTVTNGIYDTQVGSVANPLTAPFDVPYYLGINVNGTDLPVQPLSSTGYSFRAGVANRVDSANPMISTVPTGTAPLSITSTTVVTNLNSEMVAGQKLADLDNRYIRGLANGSYIVGSAPRALAFDGTSIWVANCNGNTVQKINATSGTVGSPITVGSCPNALAFDGTSMWVTNLGSFYVQKINVSTSLVETTISAGTAPSALVFDGTNIWVTLAIDNTVRKINVATGVIGSPIAVGSNPAALAYDGTNIWVANNTDRSVQKINVATGVAGSPIAVGSPPNSLAFDGTSIWMLFPTGNNTSAVQNINVTTGVIGNQITVGKFASALICDGTSIWAANSGFNTVQKIDIPTGTAGSPITVGSWPVALAWDGRSLWVANRDGNTVQKIIINNSIGDLTVGTAQIIDGAVTNAKLTGPISLFNGGTGATSASAARSNLGAAASGANSDITSLTGITTPITVAQGGTGSTTGLSSLNATNLLSGTVPDTRLAANVARTDQAKSFTASQTFSDQMLGLKNTAGIFTTTLSAPSATASRTISLPDVTGTVITTGNLSGISSVGTITLGTWNGTLGSNIVTSTNILDGSVTTSKIANGVIDSTKLSTNAVTTDAITDSNVTSVKIADGAVTDVKITGPIDMLKRPMTVSSFSSGSATVYPYQFDYTFVGSTTTVTTSYTQNFIGSAVATGNPYPNAATYTYGICYRTSGNQTAPYNVSPNSPRIYLPSNGGPLSISINMTLSPGVWEIGFCIMGQYQFDLQSVNGWIMATN